LNKNHDDRNAYKEILFYLNASIVNALDLKSFAGKVAKLHLQTKVKVGLIKLKFTIHCKKLNCLLAI
jgi:hypothetical protein